MWQIRHAQVWGACLLVAVLLAGRPVTSRAADDLVLAVQPILDEAQTRKAFQPLCDFLGHAAHRECRLFTTPNFYSYWEAVRRGTDFNLALDAAHFTDYRNEKFGFEVLVKIPDTVSYTIVTRDSEPVLDVSELVGKRVATLGIPSIGAARLNALFPNPLRQPVVIEVADAESGIRLLLTGKVNAAILPTPIISQRMAAGPGLAVVLTTDPIPHIALSAAPKLDPATRRAVRQALLGAPSTPDGREMLKKIGFERFDPADNAVYRDQARVLREYFGY